MRTSLPPLAAALFAAAASAQNPRLVADVRPGFQNPPSTNARDFVTAGGRVFFVADDVVAGPSLFVTDGTAAGTQRLRAFVSNGETVIQWATEVGGELWFAADDGVTGLEPWRSDGTTAGTVQVADVEPGPTGSFPNRFVDIGGRAVFFAFTPQYGSEPWTSQGTPATTTLLFDTRPGPVGSLVTRMVNYGGLAVFDADDGTGTDLWVSDGTAAGTRNLDVNPTGPSNPRWMCPAVLPIGFRVVFTAARPGSGGQELFVTDGTVSGTQQVADLPGDPNPNFLTWHGQHVYFAANSTSGIELWRTDGSAAGTTQVADIEAGSASSFPADLISCGSNLYFTATTATNGREPYVTQGTGATLLADLAPGFAWSSPQQFTRRGDDVFFRAQVAGLGNELWLGTAAGAQLVRDIHPTGSAFGGVLTTFAERNGVLYFGADDGSSGREPWSSDGTFAGTARIVDLAPGTGTPVSSFPNGLVADQRAVLFTADDGSTGRELWRTDGTIAGTGRIADLRPGPLGSQPQSIVRAGPRVWFTADDGQNGREPWAFDGSTTTRVDIAAGAATADPAELTDFRSLIAMVATAPTTGREVWLSDGTAAGTTAIDVVGGVGGSDPSDLCTIGHHLVFAATAPLSGREMYAYDGTNLVRYDLVPGTNGGDPGDFTVVRDVLLFAATTATHGRELWFSNLTLGGTFRLTDLAPGAASSAPSQLTSTGERVLFVADDGASGAEPWVSDGTLAGTARVADLEPGPLGSAPTSLTPFGDGVLFAATTAANGTELWFSDGTTTGTVLLVDAVPGGGAGGVTAPIVTGTRYAFFSSIAANGATTLYRTDGTAAGTTIAVPATSLGGMTPVGVFGNDLLFAADDGVTGVELWALDVGATSQPLGGPCAGGRGGPRLRVPDPVPGSLVTAECNNITAGAAAFLMLGLPPTASPFTVLGSDCWLPLDPGTISSTGLVLPTGGVVSFVIPVPGLTALIGLRFVLQAATTPSPAPWGWDVTNGVVVTIGA